MDEFTIETIFSFSSNDIRKLIEEHLRREKRLNHETEVEVEYIIEDRKVKAVNARTLNQGS